MDVARRTAALVGFIGWIYGWFLIRGIRSYYAFPGSEKMPLWVLLLMAGASTILLGASVSAAMRASAWPLISLGGPAALWALVVFGQMAVLASVFVGPVPLSEAFSQAVDDRNPVFAGGVPALLFVAGVIGIVEPALRNRGLLAAQDVGEG